MSPYIQEQEKQSPEKKCVLVKTLQAREKELKCWEKKAVGGGKDKNQAQLDRVCLSTEEQGCPP